MPPSAKGSTGHGSAFVKKISVLPHMERLSKISVSVNQALEVATASGWRVIKSDWVLNQLQGDSTTSKINASGRRRKVVDDEDIWVVTNNNS